MPRLSRLVIPDYPHYITQRGVRSMDIFTDDRDRLSYLDGKGLEDKIIWPQKRIKLGIMSRYTEDR